MADDARIERDGEVYWQLSKGFMRVLMVEVSEALQECGVKDKAVRQRIASRLGSGLGNFFDQYWFEVDGKRWYPALAFSERFADDEGDDGGALTWYGRTPDVELHPMADDEARQFFQDDGENPDAVPMGPYDGE